MSTGTAVESGSPRSAAVLTHLECSTCLEAYDETGEREPRQLHCGHTFCLGCIKALKTKTGICPMCRSAMPKSLNSGESPGTRNLALIGLLSHFRGSVLTIPSSGDSTDSAAMKEKRKKIQEQYNTFIDEKINQRSLEEAKVDDCKHEVAQYRILLAQAQTNLKEAETRVTVTTEAITSLKLEMQRELEDLANKKNEKPLLPFVPPVSLESCQTLPSASAKPDLPSTTFSSPPSLSGSWGAAKPVTGNIFGAGSSTSVFGSKSQLPPPPTAPFFAFSQGGSNPFSMTNSIAAPIPPASPSNSPAIAFVPEPMRRNFASLSLTPPDALSATLTSPSENDKLSMKSGGGDKIENHVDNVKYSNPWASSTSSFAFGSIKPPDVKESSVSSNSRAFNGWSAGSTDKTNLFSATTTNAVTNPTPFAFASTSLFNSSNMNGGHKLGGGAEKQGGGGFNFGNQQGFSFGGRQFAEKGGADEQAQKLGFGTRSLFSCGDKKAIELKAGTATMTASKSTQKKGIKTKSSNHAFESGITWPAFSSTTQSIPASSQFSSTSSTPFSFAPTPASAPTNLSFGVTSNSTSPPFSFGSSAYFTGSTTGTLAPAASSSSGASL